MRIITKLFNSRWRYFWALLWVLLAGAASAAVGDRLSHPIYRSEGLVRIAYSLPEVLQETDQNRPLLMFDTFIQSQRLLMSSRRVIDMAIQDPIWKTMGRQVPLEPDRYFAENLKVDASHGSEYLAVSVSDPDPTTAAAAVTSVINSYADLYNDQEKALERDRIGVLDDKQRSIQAQIDQVNQLLQEGLKEYGTVDLGPFFEAARARVTKLQSALSEVRTAIATAPSDASAPQAAKTNGTAPASSAGGTLGQEELPVPQAAEKSLKDLRVNERSLADLLDKEKKEMLAIGIKADDLRRKEKELESLRDQQQQLNNRITALRVEGQLGGRLSIISTGEIALSPVHDPRILMAVAAGAGGAGLSIALILAWRFARRHHSETSR